MTFNEFEEIFVVNYYKHFPYKVKARIDEILKYKDVLIHMDKIIPPIDMSLKNNITDCDSLLINLCGGTYCISYSMDTLDSCVFLHYKNYLNSYDPNDIKSKYKCDSSDTKWLCEITVFSKFSTMIRENNGIYIFWNSAILDIGGHVIEICDNTKVPYMSHILNNQEISKTSVMDLYTTGQCFPYVIKPKSVMPHLCNNNNDAVHIEVSFCAHISVLHLMKIISTFHTDVKWY